jgi:hypothetical protein
MKQYIGNCLDIIDWDSVILELEKTTPERHGFENPYGIDHDYHDIDPLHARAIEVYKDNPTSVEFFTYTNGDHYSHDINEKFSAWVGCKTFHSWISRINPGKGVPPHIDYDDVIQLEELNIPREKWLRYHCHISKPELGSVLMLGDGSSYHMEDQGSVYQWNTLEDVHTGVNIGWSPKFLFNFVGIKE